MSPFIIILCNEQSGCRWAFFGIGILSHLIQHLITVLLLMLQAKMLEPRCQLQTAWSVGDACCQEDAWGSVRLWSMGDNFCHQMHGNKTSRPFV